MSNPSNDEVFTNPFGLRLTEPLIERVKSAIADVKQRNPGMPVNKTGVLQLLLTLGLDAFEAESKPKKRARG